MKGARQSSRGEKKFNFNRGFIKPHNPGSIPPVIFGCAEINVFSFLFFFPINSSSERTNIEDEMFTIYMKIVRKFLIFPMRNPKKHMACR